MRRKERQRQRLWMDCRPHSLSPCAAWGRGRRAGSEAEPGKKAGEEEDVFSFVLLSHYPTLLLIGNKLN